MLLYALIFVPALVTGVEFCYTNSLCGPDSAAWGGKCRTGSAQSPINIPSMENHYILSRSAVFSKSYGMATWFNLENNGHTVTVTPSRCSPPLTVTGPLLNGRTYIFASLHFHWGGNDSCGSEHKINGVSYPLEAHFVHYSSEYASLSEALATNDETSLAVFGVLFQVSGYGNAELNPLTLEVYHAKNAGASAQVHLNMHNLLSAGRGTQNVVQYKGSLTTPDCNENVLWNVLTSPSHVSTQQLKDFRILSDSHGQPLINNFRPIPPRYSTAVTFNWASLSLA